METEEKRPAITLSDLPPTNNPNLRWVPRRKAKIIEAIRSGIISRETALKTYSLSYDELSEWDIAFERDGVPGLRITARLARQPKLKR